MIAISGFLTALECTKFVFWGVYNAPPDPLAGLRGPTSNGREERWERGEMEIKKEREGPAPLSQIPGSAPAQYRADPEENVGGLV